MVNNPTDKEAVVTKIENGELKVKKTRSPKAKQTGTRAKITLKRAERDTSHRQIIFSHSTAMFSMPTEVRDKAKLPELFNQGLGARVTYDENKRCIVIRLDEHP